MASPSPKAPHFVLFPFMSKGHTIPLLHLAHLLLSRHKISVTVFTTEANRPFISQFLDAAGAGHYHQSYSITVLRFPRGDAAEGIPEGVESTDKLPSMSLVPQFVRATKLMQRDFERELEKLILPSGGGVTCIVSDGFLSWTLGSASKFGVPRLSFYGMSNYIGAVSREAGVSDRFWGPESDDGLIHLPSFPWVNVTRNDFTAPFNQRDKTGPLWEFVAESIAATADSYGLLVNSFYELEPVYTDYCNQEVRPKSWCIGPLCLAVKPDYHPHGQKTKCVEWLDHKLDRGCSVLYVAFGTQAEISKEQLDEMAKGLEESKVNFLWVVRSSEPNFIEGFQERVGERGMITREWVDQGEILKHESVHGFLSHCGWNSVLESVCTKVPILAWPMAAEQYLNARMVVEEIKVGLRVETCDGSVKGFVKAEGLEKMVRELMEGEKGKEARKNLKKLGEAAKEAMEEGGSSWRTLNELIDELHAQQVNKIGDREAVTKSL